MDAPVCVLRSALEPFNTDPGALSSTFCPKPGALPPCAPPSPTASSTESLAAASAPTAATTSTTIAAPVDATHVLAAAAMQPHPAKVAKGGEDAYFIAGTESFGVADGVGGWAESGVDPGEYSEQIMQCTKAALEHSKGANNTSIEALQYAHDRVACEGSCTALVARMLPGSRLEVANLGDSGLRMLRDGQVTFATEDLQHEFNMPFQLANKRLLPETDMPEDATVDVLPVQQGDIAVVATDGFFDNVWEADLCQIVGDAVSSAPDGLLDGEAVEVLAKQLVAFAAAKSQEEGYRSPWSVECAQRRPGGPLRQLLARGGKLDDITVIVAQMQSS